MKTKPLTFDDDIFVYPAKNGGKLKITDSLRDGLGRCRFVIEWEDKTPRCEKCGCHPGEGCPAAASAGPICGSHKSLGAAGVTVCDGKMTKRRGQVFFSQPEKYVAEGVVIK